MVSQITLLVGIIFSFKITSTYSVVQYVVSALVTFVSAEVLEGETSEKHFFFLGMFIYGSFLQPALNKPSKFCICKCRSEPLPPIKRDVVPSLPWHLQWRAPLDGGWDLGPGGRRLHNHCSRVPGNRKAPQCDLAAVSGDLRCFDRVNLPDVQLPLLMASTCSMMILELSLPEGTTVCSYLNRFDLAVISQLKRAWHAL